MAFSRYWLPGWQPWWYPPVTVRWRLDQLEIVLTAVLFVVSVTLLIVSLWLSRHPPKAGWMRTLFAPRPRVGPRAAVRTLRQQDEGERLESYVDRRLLDEERERERP
jgi:hypothetical protein